MKRIDLNVDIGEGFANDLRLLAVVTSANVCCGIHAGDEAITDATVSACKSRGVRVGAHPGYPDREGMGRRAVSDGNAEEWASSVFEQCRDFNDRFSPSYIKPHGAFYHDTLAVTPSAAQRRMQAALVESLAITKLPLMGMPHTAHESLAADASVPFIKEGFADRGYLPNGLLIPRGEAGAVLSSESEVKRQILTVARWADTICIHGDTVGCVEFAQLVRTALTSMQYVIGP